MTSWLKPPKINLQWLAMA